ncbi:MAG: class I SAM-dependent methyltransferase [Terrimicrobiaceae bacterium]
MSDLPSGAECGLGVTHRGEFLEVGCGAGFLLTNAVDRGFNGLGIEVDRASLELCRARGVRVRSEDFLDFAARHQGQFDIVALSHVLEHIQEPVSWLKSIHRVLRVGGYVALAQPNHEGLVPRFFGRRWYAWDLARHCWHFTPMTLSRLLREVGFTDGDIKLLSMPHRVPFGQWADPKLFAVATACYFAGRIGLLTGSGDQFFLSAQKP